jgi:hypothetical protein
MFYIATSSIILVIIVLVIYHILDAKEYDDGVKALREHYKNEREKGEI